MCGWVGGWVGGCVGVPLKALFLVSIISNTEINMYKLKGGLPYNTDCFSYWQGTIQASYAVMRQLLYLQSGTRMIVDVH